MDGFILFKKELMVSNLNRSKVLIVEKIQDKESKLLEIFFNSKPNCPSEPITKTFTKKEILIL